MRAAQTHASLGVAHSDVVDSVDVDFVLTPYHPPADLTLHGPVRCEAARGLHVVFFVPGLGGHYTNLRLVRAAIKTHHPSILCVNARCAEGTVSEGDIVASGIALADEIVDAVEALEQQQRPVTAISFVAFSLGGIFTRIAMRTARLSPLLARANAFFTIATPHLGLPASAQASAPARFFEGLGRAAGLALVRATGRLRVLEQLSLSDGGETAVPIIERLTRGWTRESAAADDPLIDARPNAAVLSAFRTVALLASPQDGYSPHRSALAWSGAFWDGLSARTRVVRAVVHWRGGADGGGRGADEATSAAFSLSAVRSAVGTAVLGAYDVVSGRAGHTAFLDSEAVGEFLALAPELEDVWA